MRKNAISQIPIISESNKFIGLEIAKNFYLVQIILSCQTMHYCCRWSRKRLSPITDDCPKPLIPINEKPILNYFGTCINSGIYNFYISVQYLADKIINYFGDGSNECKYKIHKEDEPLELLVH